MYAIWHNFIYRNPRRSPIPPRSLGYQVYKSTRKTDSECFRYPGSCLSEERIDHDLPERGRLRPANDLKRDNVTKPRLPRSLFNIAGCQTQESQPGRQEVGRGNGVVDDSRKLRHQTVVKRIVTSNHDSSGHSVRKSHNFGDGLRAPTSFNHPPSSETPQSCPNSFDRQEWLGEKGGGSGIRIQPLRNRCCTDCDTRGLGEALPRSNRHNGLHHIISQARFVGSVPFPTLRSHMLDSSLLPSS